MPTPGIPRFPREKAIGGRFRGFKECRPSPREDTRGLEVAAGDLLIGYDEGGRHPASDRHVDHRVGRQSHERTGIAAAKEVGVEVDLARFNDPPKKEIPPPIHLNREERKERKGGIICLRNAKGRLRCLCVLGGLSGSRARSILDGSTVFVMCRRVQGRANDRSVPRVATIIGHFIALGRGLKAPPTGEGGRDGL